LRQLRGRDPKYEDPALEFAEFRAEALPGDFLGLSEIAGSGKAVAIGSRLPL